MSGPGGPRSDERLRRHRRAGLGDRLQVGVGESAGERPCRLAQQVAEIYPGAGIAEGPARLVAQAPRCGAWACRRQTRGGAAWRTWASKARREADRRSGSRCRGWPRAAFPTAILRRYFRRHACAGRSSAVALSAQRRRANEIAKLLEPFGNHIGRAQRCRSGAPCEPRPVRRDHRRSARRGNTGSRSRTARAVARLDVRPASGRPPAATRRFIGRRGRANSMACCRGCSEGSAEIADHRKAESEAPPIDANAFAALEKSLGTVDADGDIAVLCEDRGRTLRSADQGGAQIQLERGRARGAGYRGCGRRARACGDDGGGAQVRGEGARNRRRPCVAKRCPDCGGRKEEDAGRRWCSPIFIPTSPPGIWPPRLGGTYRPSPRGTG